QCADADQRDAAAWIARDRFHAKAQRGRKGTKKKILTLRLCVKLPQNAKLNHFESRITHSPTGDLHGRVAACDLGTRGGARVDVVQVWRRHRTAIRTGHAESSRSHRSDRHTVDSDLHVYLCAHR